jgi:hypothetical protein
LKTTFEKRETGNGQRETLKTAASRRTPGAIPQIEHGHAAMLQMAVYKERGET